MCWLPDLVKRKSQNVGREVLHKDSRICVINGGPFRGLKGTICAVHTIYADHNEPCYLYLVALEGIQLKEPI